MAKLIHPFDMYTLLQDPRVTSIIDGGEVLLDIHCPYDDWPQKGSLIIVDGVEYIQTTRLQPFTTEII